MSDMLLLIDVQGAWVRANPKTTGTIRQYLPALRERMDVVWVYMSNELANEHTSLRVRPGDRRLIQLHLDLPIYPSATDRIFFKCEGDAFTNPALCKHVTKTRPDTLYLAGYMGTQCVRDTALGALGLRQNFNVCVLGPLTADKRDQYHIEKFGLEKHVRQANDHDLEFLLR